MRTRVSIKALSTVITLSFVFMLTFGGSGASALSVNGRNVRTDNVHVRRALPSHDPVVEGVASESKSLKVSAGSVLDDVAGAKAESEDGNDGVVESDAGDVEPNDIGDPTDATLEPFVMPASEEDELPVVNSVGEYGGRFMVAGGFRYPAGGAGYETIWTCWNGVCEQTYTDENSIVSFSEVEIKDLNHIWYGGNGGRILFSDDAGQTWVTQKPKLEWPEAKGRSRIMNFTWLGDTLYTLDEGGHIYKNIGNSWTEVAYLEAPVGEKIPFSYGARSLVPDPSSPGKGLVLYLTMPDGSSDYITRLASFDPATDTLQEVEIAPDRPELHDKITTHFCADAAISGRYMLLLCNLNYGEPRDPDRIVATVYDSNGDWFDLSKPADSSKPRIDTAGGYDPFISASTDDDGRVTIATLSSIFSVDLADLEDAEFAYTRPDYDGDGRIDPGRRIFTILSRHHEVLISAWADFEGDPLFGRIYSQRTSDFASVNLTDIEPFYSGGDVLNMNVQYANTSERGENQYFSQVVLLQPQGTDEYYSLPSGRALSEGELDFTPFFVSVGETKTVPVFDTPIELPAGAYSSGVSCFTLYAAAVSPGKELAEITEDDILGGESNIATASFCLR